MRLTLCTRLIRTWKSRRAGRDGSHLQEIPLESSMKLHGRPLELVCTMLRVAYANVRPINGHGEEQVDILALVDPPTRARLESG